MKTLQVGDVVGDYAVVDVVGAGGMGTVYKIQHVITRRIEAMKLLPPGLHNDPDQVQRFEREIRLQASLHHPNIVALYNAVREGDSIALIMEFVEGDSLQRKVADGPLPVETAVDFTMQVLGALSYAHGSGVIHRDVSPANIIVTRDQVSKLTDFGLARGATDLRLSTSGVPLGSPWYMSPEQVKGVHDLDARTDLYSMGAVLHEMLTGKKLFEAEGSFEVMRAHVDTEPQPPSSLRPEVPAALDEIVSKALAKDPAMRFASAEEFRMAVERFAVHARMMPAPVSPVGTHRSIVSQLASRLQAMRSPREAILLLLVPAALVTGFCAVQLVPLPGHRQVTVNKPGAGAVTASDPGRPSPAPAAPVDPPVAAETSPTPTTASEAEALPASTEDTTPTPRSQSSTKARHTLPERSTALRVTGGVPSTPEFPTPRRDTPRPVDPVSDPANPKANAVEAPSVTASQSAPPSTAPSNVELSSTTPQVSPAVNPQAGGNRLVRALGKVNPFRKPPKHDPVKDPNKQ